MTTGLTRDCDHGLGAPSPTGGRIDSARQCLLSIGAGPERRPARRVVALGDREAELTASGRRTRRAALAFDVAPISIPEAVAAVSASTVMPVDADSGTGESPAATGGGEGGAGSAAGAAVLADVGVAGAGSATGGCAGGASGAGGGWEAPRGLSLIHI